MTDEHTRKAMRAQRRAAREAERADRDNAAVVARLLPGATGPSSDPGTTLITAPHEELRRRRTFKLVERAHAELVCSREGMALQLFGSAPGTTEHAGLSRRVEALNDEIDDLRELSDELLGQVQPPALDGDELAALERAVATAQAVADGSKRAEALLASAQRVLAALDDALDELGSSAPE